MCMYVCIFIYVCIYVCMCTNRVGPRSFLSIYTCLNRALMYVCVLIESVPAPFFSSSASTLVSLSWNWGGTRRGGGVFARGDGIQHVHVSQHVALVKKHIFLYFFFAWCVWSRWCDTACTRESNRCVSLVKKIIKRVVDAGWDLGCHMR
jgi:hypothetical protein